MIALIESVGASTLRIATVYILAAVGSNFAEKSGILNMTIEGNMLVSAFFAVLVSYKTGSPLLAVGAAILVGIIYSLAYGYTAITAKANQMISSLAFNLFATGLTNFLLLVFFKSPGNTPRVNAVPVVKIPLLSNIPIIGKMLFEQSPIVYVCIFLVFVAYYVLHNTKFGIRVISVGENPVAASTVGINVFRMRYLAIMIAGAMAGLAGSYLSISLSSQFAKNMTAGRGFIALSTVILGKHKPINIALAGLLFGFCDALQIRLQQSGVPTQFVQMLPYVVTVIVIAFFVGKDDNPAAIGQPYNGKS